MIDQVHWQPDSAELSKEERLPNSFTAAVTPRGYSDLHLLAKVPKGPSASKNSERVGGESLMCTLRCWQVLPSSQKLQILEVITSKI